MSGWFQEKGVEAQAKADDATKLASESGQSVQDRAVEAKDQAGSFLGEKTQAVTTAASETAEAAKKMAGEAVGKASESKDQTGGFLGEKTEAAKKAATETADAAKQKANEAADAAKQKGNDAAVYVQDRAADAAEYTKGEAPKETTGNVFQQVRISRLISRERFEDMNFSTKSDVCLFYFQAGGQVAGAAVGAKDAVMNTLGLGGDKA
jgi:hypothetical protein